MKEKATASRRRFLWTAGAAASAPLAAVATAGGAREAQDAGMLEARVAKLEDLNAIRLLHQTFAQLTNARAYRDAEALFVDPATAGIDESISSVATDGVGGADEIELAADGRSATARVRCTVRTESPIGPDCTLVAMARAQGEGYVRSTATRVLVTDYVKLGDDWKIRRSTWLAPG